MTDILSTGDVHVALGSGAWTRSDIINAAIGASALGYGGVWVAEAVDRDAFSLLTEIVLNTDHIEVGTGVANIYGRTPTTLAMAAASLMEIAPGRVFNLGLGASTRSIVEGLHGISYDRPVQRMAEAVEIIRLGIDGQQMAFRGDIFDLDGRFRLKFGDSNGVIRLVIAALSPRMLDTTIRKADGWLAIWPSKSQFSFVVDDMEQKARTAERPRPWIASYIYTCLDSGQSSSESLLRQVLASYVANSGPAYAQLFRGYG